MIPVFPPRNLPSRAQPWGREVENKIRALYSATEGLNNDISNRRRAESGTSAALGSQVYELFQRGQVAVNLPDTTQTVSVPYNVPGGAVVSGSTSAPVDPPSGTPRKSQVVISGSLVGTNPDINGTVTGTASIGGSSVNFLMYDPWTGNTPPGWTDAFSVIFYAPIFEGGVLNVSYTSDLYNGESPPQTRTTTTGLENIRCYLSFGDKI